MEDKAYAAACAKGHPKAGKELNERNLCAYQHYRECAAVGRFPADPLVARNAAEIAEVLKVVDRIRRLEELRMMIGAGGR